MALREFLLPWDSQPQEATGVDRGNPLGAKLRYASTLGPNVLDVTSGRLATINNAPLTQVGPKGLFRDFVPASSQFLTLPTSNIVSGYPLTVSAWIRFDNLSTTGFIAYSLIGSTYGAIFGQSATAANTLQFNTGSAPGFDGFSAVTAGIVVGEWNHYVLVHRSGSAAAFLNGKPVTITNVGANYGEPAAGNQAIGQRLNGASPRYFDGGIQDFYVFEGELTAAEVQSLYQDHYQVFAPRSIWVPVSVGGGSASTITAAAGASTASTLAASSTAASTPTAAAGTATASTVAASSTAATAITSATGAATASTLTGSAVVARAITAAAGVGAASTVAATSTAASAITQATGSATASTMVGTGLTAGASAIMPATGAATASTMTGAATAAAAITPAAGVATGQTLVPASTVSSASMTPAAGAASAATFAASAVAASVAIAAAGASSAQVMAATAQAVAAINAAAGTSVCSTLANADAAIVVLGSLAGSTRKPGAIRSNVQTAVRSNRQTAKR